MYREDGAGEKALLLHILYLHKEGEAAKGMARKRRKKIGRPPTLDNPVNFTIRIDKDLIERAREAAWDHRTTLSEYVREALARLAAGKPKRRTGRS